MNLAQYRWVGLGGVGVRGTQLVAWNSEPPLLSPGWSLPFYFVAVANMHFKQILGKKCCK